MAGTARGTLSMHAVIALQACMHSLYYVSRELVGVITDADPGNYRYNLVCMPWLDAKAFRPLSALTLPYPPALGLFYPSCIGLPASFSPPLDVRAALRR